MSALSPASVVRAPRSSRQSTLTDTASLPRPYTVAGTRPSARSRLLGRVPVVRPVAAGRVISAIGSPTSGIAPERSSWERCMLRAMDAFTPAVEIAAAIRRKEISPVEVADLYLDRIEQFDGTLNAFCHRADDEVRAAPKRAADVVATSDTADLPPFYGVPLPIKDLNAVAGWPSTRGSRGTSWEPQTESDLVVERFVEAGFILLGMTNAPEFGTVSYTESDAHGVTRNPWNPDHTPGGSSGGAGAAVASGMAPIAHASDGGGSIRIPSSCCGLVGIKPSRNRITDWVETMTAAA